jgi:hypothetical protein
VARAGLQDIITALADQIRSVLEQVDEIDVQVEPRWVVVPSPLTVDVYFGDPSRDDASAGFDDVSGAYILTVRARINTPDFDAAYDILVALADDTDDLSLAMAILDEPTLNGYAGSLHLRDFSGLRAFERISGDGADLGFQITALVIPAES